MAYPVRTKASHFITGVDCVVFFRKPLNPTDEALISEATKERLAASVARLDLPAKSKILFNVSLISQKLDHDVREALQVRLYNGQKTGELEALGESLGFAATVVRFD